MKEMDDRLRAVGKNEMIPTYIRVEHFEQSQDDEISLPAYRRFGLPLLYKESEFRFRVVLPATTRTEEKGGPFFFYAMMAEEGECSC
jgi:hypothetical protein